jgi:hypothetical protein
VSGSTVRPETLALIEDVEWLLSWGEPPERIIPRVGKTRAAIQQTLRRHGNAAASKFDLRRKA